MNKEHMDRSDTIQANASTRRTVTYSRAHTLFTDLQVLLWHEIGRIEQCDMGLTRYKKITGTCTVWGSLHTRRYSPSVKLVVYYVPFKLSAVWWIIHGWIERWLLVWIDGPVALLFLLISSHCQENSLVISSFKPCPWQRFCCPDKITAVSRL